MRRLVVVISLLLSSLIISSTGYAQAKRTLLIFAASSLTDAFNEIKIAFEAVHPDVEITYSFGASSTLAAQLKEGAPADLFASANNSQMTVVIDAGGIKGKPCTFARNHLVLIVPASNPARIASIRDLSKHGIKLVLAAPKVPVRDYTDAMLDKLAKLADYGEEYKQAVIANIVSEEDNVRQVAAKVALGEADAGIVYRSDVTRDIGDKVLMLLIPDEVNTIATYPIAITSTSANPDVAQLFIEYVLSEAGQMTLDKWNFIGVGIEHEILEF
jgi:molybdate transport system substrate-binding protein